MNTLRPTVQTDSSAASRAAILAVSTFVLLTVVMDWVPNPLNANISQTPTSARLPGTLIHVSAGLLVCLVVLARRYVPMAVGAIWYSVVLVSAGVNWWLPYLAGVTVGEVDESSIREYAANPRVLPALPGRAVVPDVQHMLLHAAIAGACVCTWLAVLELRRGRLRQARRGPAIR